MTSPWRQYLPVLVVMEPGADSLCAALFQNMDNKLHCKALVSTLLGFQLLLKGFEAT
jgi:hypothetical protein